MLKILRESNGGAVTVDDEEMIRVTREVGSTEGLFVAPEGAACFAALRKLLAAGKIAPEERIVIFNTGSGIKYLDCYDSERCRSKFQFGFPSSSANRSVNYR